MWTLYSEKLKMKFFFDMFGASPEQSGTQDILFLEVVKNRDRRAIYNHNTIISFKIRQFSEG